MGAWCDRVRIQVFHMQSTSPTVYYRAIPLSRVTLICYGNINMTWHLLHSVNCFIGIQPIHHRIARMAY